MDREQIDFGAHTLEEWERILRTASHIEDTGERVQFLSDHFIDTAYAESTLKGDHRAPEILVVNLHRVDCMTFLEYIEAMRLSSSFPEFIGNLKRVRYKSGSVDFVARNHFFTDWKEFNADTIEEVTAAIGGMRTVCIHKKLNEKEDGTPFLQGIQPVVRAISYIPSDMVDEEVMNNLRGGDYTGIYSPLDGLDVSHAGIIVRHNNVVYFRHASSQPWYRRVIDQDFREYITGKPGIVVFRPKMQI
jgi:hypothetical protein